MEREIDHWLSVTSEFTKSCLIITRHIPDINLRHKHAGRYIDLCKDGLDRAVQQQLLSLLEHKLFPKLPLSTVFQYTDLEWSNSKHGGVTEAEHHDYLDDFASDFITALQALIDDTMKSRVQAQQEADESDVYKECLAHARVASELCGGFHGRDRELKMIRAYVNEAVVSEAMVVCGPLGGGKSALLARAASLVSLYGHNYTFTIHANC